VGNCDAIFRSDTTGITADEQHSTGLRFVDQQNSGQMDVDASDVSFKKALQEFIAMTLFVIIGCGSAMGVVNKTDKNWVLQVSLTFGLAITALAAATGGGQINCAVTLGLTILGNISVGQAVVNFVAQMLGSILGAAILSCIYSEEADNTKTIGCNAVTVGKQGFDHSQALLAEAVMTFLLVYVVANVAVLANQVTRTISIGFAVFLAHSVLIPIDGCSINPTRSFGPALIASMTRSEGSKVFADMWVFWVGPLIGAAAAALVVKMLCGTHQQQFPSLLATH